MLGIFGAICEEIGDSLIIKMRIIILLVFIGFNLLFSQKLIYYNKSWHHFNFYTINDTLQNYGIQIDFVDSIEWEDLVDCRAIWIFEPTTFTIPPRLYLTIDEINNLRYFLKIGGNIFIGDSWNSVSISEDSLIPRPLLYNVLFLLLGTTMFKKIVYPGDFIPYVNCNIFFNFPPFTNNVDSIIL